MIICPGKISRADPFRIGAIGRLFEAEIGQLLNAIGDGLEAMGCRLAE